MGVWLSTLVVLAAAGGEPAPSVVVLPVATASSESASSAFVENLRIQLTGLASVTLGPEARDEAPAERAERARLYLSATGAAIAVWKEPRRDARTGRALVVVLAVTRDPSERPIEVARVDGQGDDADRVLALKVGELLHQVLASAKTERELARALREREAAEELPPKPTPQPSRASSTAARRFRGLAEAGLGLRADSRLAGQQVAFRGNLGVAAEHHQLRLELALGLRKPTRLEFRVSNGRLTVDETAATAELRALVALPPLLLGAHAGASASFLSASASTLDDRRGAAGKTAWWWSGGPELRLQLLPQLEMRTQVGLEGPVYDQQFAIEGRVVEAGPQPRFSADLSLVLLLP